MCKNTKSFLKQADIHKDELTDLIKKIDRQLAQIKKTNADVISTKTQLENIFIEMTDVVYSIKLPEREVLFITPSVSILYEVEAKSFIEDFSLWEKSFHTKLFRNRQALQLGWCLRCPRYNGCPLNPHLHVCW